MVDIRRYEPGDSVTLEGFNDMSEPYRVTEESEIDNGHFVDNNGNAYRVLGTRFGCTENVVMMQRFDGVAIHAHPAVFFSGGFLKLPSGRSDYRWQRQGYQEAQLTFVGLLTDFRSEILGHGVSKAPNVNMRPKDSSDWVADHRRPLEVSTGCNHTDVAWVTWYLTLDSRGLL